MPAFIVVALGLIVFQPRISALAGRRAGARRRGLPGPAPRCAVFATGIYGGYFGAAQGIMLLAILGLVADDDLQRINALKVVLAGLVNLIAGVDLRRSPRTSPGRRRR